MILSAMKADQSFFFKENNKCCDIKQDLAGNLKHFSAEYGMLQHHQIHCIRSNGQEETISRNVT